MSSESGFSSTQSWAYRDIAAEPLPPSIEDHFLAALKRLTATLDVAGVCEAVLSGVEDVFGATSSWIMLHDAEADVLRTCLFRGHGAEAYGDAEIPARAGIAGLVFTGGDIQFVADALSYPRWYDPARVHASGLRSALVLPLVSAQTCMGVLGLDSPAFTEAQPPTPLDIRRLEVFAAQAAIGLMNARLYQASQRDRARMRGLLRERRTLRQQVLELRDEVRGAFSFGPIVGESAALRAVLAEVEQVAGSDVTVLLLGETGTGKELLARALHERGGRSARPFVPVNCAALPDQLIESELFGHERGAFTGAHIRKPGRFEVADRGTLFLDEIGDLPANAQAKLLRVLQNGEVQRVGGTQPTKVNVRIVAATHQDLAARVSDRGFREDLFYRLSVFPIRVPPLRERSGDIPILAKHLTTQCARRVGKRVVGITDEVLSTLAEYSWPGNVRELQNVIERAVILASNGVVTLDTIRLDRIPPIRAADRRRPGNADRAAAPREQPPARHVATAAAPLTLAEAERTAILDALQRAEGRVSGAAGAAALLGLKPTTLHAKMKKLGLRRGDALRR
jgi:formate hydrogenlyase transcriptional activator